MTEEKPWHERSDIWKDAHAHLKPELLDHIVLGPADVQQLTELAMHAEDPAAWLGEELNRRGQRKKDIKAAHKAQQMKEDARRISNPSSWPGLTLPVKTQPWHNEDGKSMRFGFIRHNLLLTVNDRDGNFETFMSVEELVEKWSVD